MTFIKFCGMTREQDLAIAAELGIDAVGFVLWPGSPRYVPIQRAKALINELPSAVMPVGVFVSPTRGDVEQATHEAGIRVAQIHGDARDAIGNESAEVWLAASLSGDDVVPPVNERYLVLLDTPDTERYGGTGRTIDWTRAARVAAKRRVVLAGGLTPTNVAQAIRAVRPYGVDVASGIEQSPGVKTTDAMRAFVAAVREADR